MSTDLLLYIYVRIDVYISIANGFRFHRPAACGGHAYILHTFASVFHVYEHFFQLVKRVSNTRYKPGNGKLYLVSNEILFKCVFTYIIAYIFYSILN